MRILILGAGMYVTGRNNTGTGTILSSLAECSKTLPIEEVLIVARSAENKNAVREAKERINTALGSNLEVNYHQLTGAPLEDEIARICSDREFSAAVVSTPDHVHFECIRALMVNHLHVLTVKPFVPTVKEAEDLIYLQQKHGVYGAVEFHKRFDESNLYAKRMISSGELGKLLYVDVDYSQRISIPTEVFSGWSDKTNIFQYLAVHYVDLIYFMTGFKPTSLCAYGTNGILKSKGIDTHDSIHVMLEWQDPDDQQNRFISQFNMNWIDPECTSAMSDQKIKLVGTDGRLDCDQKNRGIQLVSSRSGIMDVNPYFSEYLMNMDGGLTFNGYGHESIKQFVVDIHTLGNSKNTDDIEHLNRNRPSFRDALISTAVIETVNLALTEGPGWKHIHGIS